MDKKNSMTKETHIVWFESNLKKSVLQMLLLQCFLNGEHYISEVAEDVNRASDGCFFINTSYKSISRLYQSGYLVKTQKRKSPDGRARQYYGITQLGRDYLQDMLTIYDTYTASTATILRKNNQQH